MHFSQKDSRLFENSQSFFFESGEQTKKNLVKNDELVDQAYFFGDMNYKSKNNLVSHQQKSSNSKNDHFKLMKSV